MILLAQSRGVACIALLTTDMGFLGQIRHIVSLRKHEIWIFIPAGAASSIRLYKETGAGVLPVATTSQLAKVGRGPKVRAVLQPDGNGIVKMAEPWVASPADSEAFDQLHSSLQDLGYRGESGYLVQSVAKFGFSNHPGRLAVYPAQAACAEAQAVLQATGSRGWARSVDKFAFVLPVSTGGSKTRRKCKDYGGMASRRVFKGGGPFIIKDSEGLVAEALCRMGYMDASFNSDLPEALFVFVNRPQHKSTLRKAFEALPVPGGHSL